MRAVELTELKRVEEKFKLGIRVYEPSDDGTWRLIRQVDNNYCSALTAEGLHAMFTPHETKLTSTDLKPSLRQLLLRLWRRL